MFICVGLVHHGPTAWTLVDPMTCERCLLSLPVREVDMYTWMICYFLINIDWCLQWIDYVVRNGRMCTDTHVPMNTTGGGGVVTHWTCITPRQSWETYLLAAEHFASVAAWSRCVFLLGRSATGLIPTDGSCQQEWWAKQEGADWNDSCQVCGNVGVAIRVVWEPCDVWVTKGQVGRRHAGWPYVFKCGQWFMKFRSRNSRAAFNELRNPNPHH